MHSIAFALRLCLLSAFVLVAACSGGGGGGGDGGGGSAPGFSVSPGSLTFSAASTSSPTPPPQSITVTVTAGQVFFAAFFAGPAIANATFTITGQTTARIDVFPASPAVLGAGTFTGTIRIVGCSDPNCNSQVANSPRDINVTYQIAGLVISPSSVSLSAIEGTNSAAVPVNVSSTSGSASWTTSISYAAGGPVGWLSVPANGGSLPATLNVSGGRLPAGQYFATITVSVGAVSLPIPVTYNVLPNLSVPPGPVIFEAAIGQPSPPAAQTVPVSATVATSYTTTVTYLGVGTDWLGLSGNSAPGDLVVSPNTTNLTPGLHSAIVTLTPANGAGVSFEVQYTLSPSALTLTPASVTFDIDVASTSADAFLRRTVRTGHTGAALTWTAGSSVPWLTVVNGSGASGDNATLALVLAELGLMGNGAYSGTVTFTYSGPAVTNATQTLNVTLNLNVPTVNFVAPYVGYVNEQREVIIRGSGFLQANPVPVMFGNQQAQSVDVRSDTEVRAVPPNFAAAGRHDVTIANGLGLDRSRAEFVVRERPVYPYFSMPTGFPTQSLRVIYDAERDAVISFEPALFGSVPMRRFSYNSGTGTWSMTTQMFPSGLLDIAMTPDGRELLILTGTTLLRADPVTLSINSSIPLPIQNTIAKIGVANDGVVILLRGERTYSLLTNSFSPLAFPTPVFGIDFSADGSRGVMGDIPNQGTSPLLYYDASTGTIQSTTTLRRYSNRASLNRNAERFMLNSEVFDRNLAPMGFLNRGLDIAFSPDGNRAYSFFFLANDDVTVVVSDTSVNAAFFPELSSFVVADAPGVGGWAISLDGGTLFAVGNNNFVVQPLP